MEIFQDDVTIVMAPNLPKASPLKVKEIGAPRRSPLGSRGSPNALRTGGDLGKKKKNARKMRSAQPQSLRTLSSTSPVPQKLISTVTQKLVHEPPLHGPSPPPTASMSVDTGMSQYLTMAPVKESPSCGSPADSTVELAPLVSIDALVDELRNEVRSGSQGGGGVLNVPPGKEAHQLEVERLQGCLENAAQKNDALVERQAELQVERDLEVASWNSQREAFSTTMKTLESKLEAARQDVDGLQDGKLQPSLMIKQQAETWKCKLQEKTERAKQLQDQLAVAQKAQDMAAAATNAVQSEKACVEAQVKQQQQLVRSLQAQLDVALARTVTASAVDRALEKAAQHETEQLLSETQEFCTNLQQEKAALEQQLSAKMDRAAHVVPVVQSSIKPVTLCASELGLMDCFETVESVIENGEEMKSRNQEQAAMLQLKEAETDHMRAHVMELETQLQLARAYGAKSMAERDEAIALGAEAIANFNSVQEQLDNAVSQLGANATDLEATDAWIEAIFNSLETELPAATDNRLQLLENIENMLGSKLKELTEAQDQVQHAKAQAGEAKIQLAEMTAAHASEVNRAQEFEAALSMSKSNGERKEAYTKEQRAKIEELTQHVLALRDNIDEVQRERDALSLRVTELEKLCESKAAQLAEGQSKLADMQETIQRLSSDADAHIEEIADGQAALARCEELEGKLESLESAVYLSKTQRRRAQETQCEAEEDQRNTATKLVNIQMRVEELEASTASTQSELEGERAARAVAEAAECEAVQRCRTAEFDRQLLESEKGQMMMKLDMLLMTRGEPLEVVSLVRSQTELEVEVRSLKAQLNVAKGCSS